MSKISSEYRRKNNIREKEILPENQEIYTDMIVYLRVADMNEYNQEKVREDIINMIVDGQNRGEDIKAVIGENYKEVCDGIIEEMPKKTRKEKVMEAISLTLNLLWIMGLISVIISFASGSVSEENGWKYQCTIGYFISFIAIGIIANLIVYCIGKHTLDNKDVDKASKIKEIIFGWIICVVAICVVMAPTLLLKEVLFTVHIAVLLAVCIALMVIDVIISRKY